MNELVNKAKLFSKHYHTGQLYGDGRDYFVAHIEPVVAKAIELAKKIGLDVQQVAVLAYLHDVLEDCDSVSLEMIKKNFGESVLDDLLVLSNRIASLKTPMRPLDEYLYTIGQSSPEVKIVKVADRIVNISNLVNHIDEKRKVYLEKKYAEQSSYFKKYDIYFDLISDL